MLVVINPFGPVHTVFRVTGTSTAGLNSTVQVKVTADPTGRTGLAVSLVTVTDVGDGTNQKKKHYLKLVTFVTHLYNIITLSLQ